MAIFDCLPKHSLSGNMILADWELKVMGVQYILPQNMAPEHFHILKDFEKTAEAGRSH